jgi:LEA14-like dessication related protein
MMIGASGRPIRAGVALLAAAFFVAGCAVFVKEPRVTIADVRVVSLGLAGGTARVELEVDNPNRFDLSVRTLSYRMEVAEGPASPGGEERWIRLAEEEEVEREILAPARQTVRVEVPVAFEYRALGAAVRSLLLDGEVRYRVQGAVRVLGPVGEHRLPFGSNGRMKP